jgi:hypothetical protein
MKIKKRYLMTPKIKTIFNRNIYGPSTNRSCIKGWETLLQRIIHVYGLLHPTVSPLPRHIFRGTTQDSLTSNAFAKPQRNSCSGRIIVHFITPIISDKNTNYPLIMQFYPLSCHSTHYPQHGFLKHPQCP